MTAYIITTICLSITCAILLYHTNKLYNEVIKCKKELKMHTDYIANLIIAVAKLIHEKQDKKEYERNEEE